MSNQSDNSTNETECAYATLTALLKLLNYSPIRAVSLKLVQQVVDVLELKIAKASDTRWMAHKTFVKAANVNYGVIVTALNDTKQQQLVQYISSFNEKIKKKLK